MTELFGLLLQLKTYGPMIFLVGLAHQHLTSVGRLKKLESDHDRLKRAFGVILTAKQRKRLEDLELL